MGDKASSTDARGLRAQLEGLNSAEQQKVAYQWALANDKFLDLLGDFANERKLLIFKSGNECENWIDPVLNLVYKMNTLMHVGGNIAKLFKRIEQFNMLFPSHEHSGARFLCRWLKNALSRTFLLTRDSAVLRAQFEELEKSIAERVTKIFD